MRKVQRSYLDDIKPLLETSCGDCHWGAGSDADLDLSKYETIDELLNASSTWKKVVRRVESLEMPPEDSEPMDEEDRKKLLNWFDELFGTIDCAKVAVRFSATST